MTKVCTKCKIEKPLNGFSKDRNKKTGYVSSCKECRNTWFRHWNATSPIAKLSNQRRVQKYQSSEKGRRQLKHYDLKKSYGLTIDQFEDMERQQNGLCAICASPPDCGPGNRLSVDHNHETSEVRGLLCSICNIGLGHFKDNSELLIKAAEYLEVHKKSLLKLVKGVQ